MTSRTDDAAVLIELDEHGLGRLHRVAGECLLGRHPDCHIQIIDPDVSKQHARLAPDGPRGGYRVHDLGSLNGVFVNGERVVDSRQLQPNDLLGLGAHRYLWAPDLSVLPTGDGDRAALLIPDVATRPAAPARPAPQDEAALGGLPAGMLAEALSLLADQGGRALPGLLRLVGRHLAFDTAAVLRAHDAEPGEALCVLGEDPLPAFSRALATQALANRAGLRVGDLAGDARLKRAGPASLLAAPLALGGRLAGVVLVGRAQADAFRAEDLELLQSAAPLLAAALSAAERAGAGERVRPSDGRGEPAALAGRSPAMEELRGLVRKVAPTPTPVLLLGETGTGKELVARWLHHLGPGPGRPFVALNCGALPESLAEAELFGAEKGAYSGADRSRPGKLELAAGGTLFLDEIGELGLGLQVKLLRALESHSFYRLGGRLPLEARFRLLSATHRDLKAMVDEGAFRADLYYRIHVLPVRLSPLRDRPEDVEPLATGFLRDLAAELGRPACRLTPRALARLEDYPWPGNARELRNVLERAAVLAEGAELDLEDLPAELSLGAPRGAGAVAPGPDRLAGHVAALERQVIAQALRRTRGNKSAAARLLGISRPTLDKRISQYGLGPDAEG